MLWLMSCPPGEGRCYGEGAKLSHWASIILSVAVSLLRRSFEIGVFFESRRWPVASRQRESSPNRRLTCGSYEGVHGTSSIVLHVSIIPGSLFSIRHSRRAAVDR